MIVILLSLALFLFLFSRKIIIRIVIMKDNKYGEEIKDRMGCSCIDPSPCPRESVAAASSSTSSSSSLAHLLEEIKVQREVALSIASHASFLHENNNWMTSSDSNLPLLVPPPKLKRRKREFAATTSTSSPFTHSAALRRELDDVVKSAMDFLFPIYADIFDHHRYHPLSHPQQEEEEEEETEEEEEEKNKKKRKNNQKIRPTQVEKSGDSEFSPLLPNAFQSFRFRPSSCNEVVVNSSNSSDDMNNDDHYFPPNSHLISELFKDKNVCLLPTIDEAFSPLVEALSILHCLFNRCNHNNNGGSALGEVEEEEEGKRKEEKGGAEEEEGKTYSAGGGDCLQHWNKAVNLLLGLSALLFHDATYRRVVLFLSIFSSASFRETKWGLGVVCPFSSLVKECTCDEVLQREERGEVGKGEGGDNGNNSTAGDRWNAPVPRKGSEREDTAGTEMKTLVSPLPSASTCKRKDVIHHHYPTTNHCLPDSSRNLNELFQLISILSQVVVVCSQNVLCSFLQILQPSVMAVFHGRMKNTVKKEEKMQKKRMSPLDTSPDSTKVLEVKKKKKTERTEDKDQGKEGTTHHHHYADSIWGESCSPRVTWSVGTAVPFFIWKRGEGEKDDGKGTLMW